jgi:hypothetical protein
VTPYCLEVDDGIFRTANGVNVETIRIFVIRPKLRVSTLYIPQGVPFKTQPKSNHVPRYKNEIRSTCTPVTLESRSPYLLGRCSRQLRKSYAGANMVHSRALLLILEHYFASKSFAAVREALSRAHPDKEVPNKITHRLVAKQRTQKCMLQETCPTSDSADRCTAVL